MEAVTYKRDSEKGGNVRYFAFGSNMNPEQMASRCPGAVPIAVARLYGYRLTFEGHSAGWGGAVCNVRPAVRQHADGVLWEVTAAHLEALDRFEGVRCGAYSRAVKSIVLASGARVTAHLYVQAQSWHMPGVPSDEYVRAVLSGARAFGIDTASVRQAIMEAGYDRGRATAICA